MHQPPLRPHLPNHHTLPIIGIHRSPLTQKFGIPRQPNLVNVATYIQMLPPYDTSDAFSGIDKYSHLWILWQFHHNKPQTHFRPQVRPPRLGGNDKMGVFATRSMYRPSQMGLSVVRFMSIKCDSSTQNTLHLHILGADMIDGTPILDIKPYLPYSDCIMATSVVHAPTIRSVIWADMASTNCQNLIKNNQLQNDDIDIIAKLIAQDPRPAYRQNQLSTPFVMRYGRCDVVFCDDGDNLVIKALNLVE